LLDFNFIYLHYCIIKKNLITHIKMKFNKLNRLKFFRVVTAIKIMQAKLLRFNLRYAVHPKMTIRAVSDSHFSLISSAFRFVLVRVFFNSFLTLTDFLYREIFFIIFFWYAMQSACRPRFPPQNGRKDGTRKQACK
jgi:hypothetical protein